MQTQGMFDLQINGYAGVDFNDCALTPAALDHALGALLADGVTACLPTLITAAPEALRARFAALDRAVRESKLGSSMVPGYHLEGPFLNDGPGYRGCHPAEAMRDPQTDPISELETEISHPILLVTIAPERAGALSAIETMAAQGRTVAIGHSAADFAQVRAAARAGVSLSTHLGNGLPRQLPKLNNTLLAQLAEPSLAACLIADGHHVAPDELAALIALKGAERCILVSDAVVAAAAEPGRYGFAGMTVEAHPEGWVGVPGRPGLAGSALRLDQAVRNLAAWNIADPPQAARMATDRPLAALARSLDRFGISLDPGTLEWSSNLEPRVMRRGAIAT